MKKTLLLFLLGLSVFRNETKAQYHPILGDSTRWCMMWNFFVVRSGDRSLEGSYQAYNDTTISTNSYKQVFVDGSYFGAMREDSAAQKAYFVYAGNTSEELLYDFTLALGDTINIDLHNNVENNLQDGDYIVDSVATMNILGGTRKFLRLHNPNNTTTGPNGKPLKLHWVESVGDIYFPFYLYMYDGFGIGMPNWFCGNESMCEVINNEVDGVKNYINACAFAYPNGEIQNDSCHVDYAGSVNELAGQNLKLSVYPNPSNGKTFSVSLPSNQYFAGDMQLVITDLNGRHVFSTLVKIPGNTVTIGQVNLQDGMYLVSLHSKGTLIGKGKLLVE